MTSGRRPRVLRLCSTFGVRGNVTRRAAMYDAVGGMQNHTAALTAALDASGFTQEVVTAYRPGAPRTEAWGMHARVHRVGMPVRHVRQLWATPAVALAMRLAERVDLVHAHLGEDLAVLPMARWIAKRSGSPLIVTVHCSVANTIEPAGIRATMLCALGGRLERSILPAADAVLVLTERLRSLLALEGVDHDRIGVIPLGIDLERFTPSARDARRAPSIVYIGRLTPSKGVDVLLEAFALLPRRDVTLRLIGDGPERRRLEERAHRLGVAGRVRFLGAVAPQEVVRHAAGGRAMVLPSRYEELGRVNVEGMSMGLPVIASRVGGIPDVVLHEINGLLVEPDRPSELAAALERILDDERFAARLIRAGRETATRHSIQALSEHVARVYLDLATPRARNALTARGERGVLTPRAAWGWGTDG